ncbi:YchJ family protein [Flavobacterium sp. FlaQc-30]|uniref:YchJ family protein n=1 Tax=Flavobacterium sp. FlaQc-30 TaxID=3374179 RepID=UPI00375675C9
MENKKCFCDTGLPFDECCGLYLSGSQKAPSALALMRSRYSAYATHNADYLMETTYISKRKYYSKPEILRWAKENTWLQLSINEFTETTVVFNVYFLNSENQSDIHYEFSTFKFENGAWYYLEGKFE